MSLMDMAEEAVDHLVAARAALHRMREDVHGGGDGCGTHCADYHDAMRSVTRAAEAIGLPVSELNREAIIVNRERYGFVGFVEVVPGEW